MSAVTTPGSPNTSRPAPASKALPSSTRSVRVSKVFPVGQQVFAHNRPGGNWSEYVVVPAQTAWPVPDDIPDEQVASLMINPATAILMVRHVLAVPREQWLLQPAAGSELGRMIIRLARHIGPDDFMFCRSDDDPRPHDQII